MSYSVVIGLEVHAQLSTRTKMFCGCRVEFGAEPNTLVCPVCLGMPGALPVPNAAAVECAVKLGLACGASVEPRPMWTRKNYFYPDLPKGYQISQYEFPLVSGGALNGINITRIHLEEDTASSIHDATTLTTVIDFNRAGLPLMELVTEPEIQSAQAAGEFARELQLLLRYLGVSDSNMEKGEMRVEANVSVQSTVNGKQKKLGTKVEIKNLNSFRAMERAVEYEIKRQTELLESGGSIAQETRGWDERKQATFPQRTKEGSADYRYFPDPDLPSLRLSEISEFAATMLKSQMPELPSERRERYHLIGLKSEDVEMFVRQPGFGTLFDEVVGGYPSLDPRVLMSANYIANNLAGIRDIEDRDAAYSTEIPMNPDNFRVLISMVSEGRITTHAAKEILSLSASTGRNPEEIAIERGLLKIAMTEDLESIVSRILVEYANVVVEYRAGKKAALQFLIGKAMRASGGAADPTVLRKLLEERISV